MEFKGTKGKWKVYQPNHIGCTNVKFGSEEWDGFVELWYHHSSEKEAKANALLISKAPEMLDTLKKAKLVISRLKLSMLAHPDCTNGSEFDDRTTSAQELENEIEQLLKQATEL